MHIHRYRFIVERGVNRYYECRCGTRRYTPGRYGYSPVDRHWLTTGTWMPEPLGPPPAIGSSNI